MSESKLKISIVDYGVGNLHSITKALEHFADGVIITEESDVIKKSRALVLPGVGSFEAGMRGIEKRNLTDAIKEFASSGKPILGICLGAQLLMSKGYEFGTFNGLGIIKGKVVAFPKLEKKVKMPHIGWNKIYPTRRVPWNNTILKSIKKNSDVYFVHSYIFKPKNEDDILALSEYGGYEFCSAIKSNNIYGCQFHPEKSGEIGLKIIKNFIKNA